MKNILIAFILSTLVFSSCQKETLNPTNLSEEIEQMITPHMSFGRAPGVAVGIIHDGNASQYFYGTKNLKTG